MGEKYQEPRIEKLPTNEEVLAALRVLNNQWLHWYQLLMAKGFDRIFSVKRVEHKDGIPTMRIEIFPKMKPDWGFIVDGTDADSSVIERVQKLYGVLDAEKPHQLSCCPLAESVNCVCVASFDCPVHGKFCIGNHD